MNLESPNSLPATTATITSLRGTRDVVMTNETYCVEGTYTLHSHEKALLGFFATVPNSGPTPTDPREVSEITNGTGTFRLIKTVHDLGYLHVSFYEGDSFGGVYFGQGEWILREKVDHSINQETQPLFKYLGNPVPRRRQTLTPLTRSLA